MGDSNQIYRDFLVQYEKDLQNKLNEYQEKITKGKTKEVELLARIEVTGLAKAMVTAGGGQELVEKLNKRLEEEKEQLRILQDENRKRDGAEVEFQETYMLQSAVKQRLQSFN